MTTGRFILLTSAATAIGSAAIVAIVLARREPLRPVTHAPANTVELSPAQPASGITAPPSVPENDSLLSAVSEPTPTAAAESPVKQPTTSPALIASGAAIGSVPIQTSDQPLGEPRIPLETARAALALVGEDPVAEAVWMQAINDPNMSKHDRSDLIEDLNEEGFPDTKGLTQDHLAKVMNRLAIIERLAPEAMDETNAAAFAEAHKDLVNILKRLLSP